MVDFNQNYNQGLQQGLDRISSLLQERSAPKTSDFGMDSQSLGISPNISNMLLMDSANSILSGKGSSYGQLAQDYVSTQRKNQMEDANSMLAVLKEQAALGDKESKDFHDVLEMVVGKDPMKQAQIIQELDQNPDFHSLSNPNRTQMLTFGAGAAKKLGLSNTDFEMAQRKAELANQEMEAKIGLYNAKSELASIPAPKPTQLQKTLSNKIAEDVQSANQDMKNISTMEDAVTQLDQLLQGGVSTGNLSKFGAALDVGNLFQNTRDLQKMEQLVNQIALPKTASLKGATSDKDVKFVKGAFANAGSSNEANQFAVETAKRFIERQKAIANLYNDMVSDPQYGTNPELFYKDLRTEISKLPSLEEEMKGSHEGGKLIGTSGGKNVYQMPDGTYEMDD